MSEEVLDKLVAELECSPASVPSIDGLSPEDAEQAFDAINSMYRVRLFSNVPFEEFVDDLCDSLREHEELDADAEPMVRERLIKVLSIESLNVAAKALSLHLEHEHMFCTARIITDARPVYRDNPTEPPAAMVVTHVLKLSYHETGIAGRLKEFYVGLGSLDLEEIRDTLERAEEKAKSLKAVFDSAGIKLIDPQRD
jgi:hypothetical protein